MFQAPLFYIVAAVVYRGLTLVTAAGTAALWLRWLTLLCGVAQVELCYRAGRLVFPGRDDLQSLAVLFGGLLPMNVYMSQTLGNEPLCGVFSAVIVFCAGGCCVSRRPLRTGPTVVAGSGFRIGPHDQDDGRPARADDRRRAGRRQQGRAHATASVFGRCFVAAAIVSGWYYVLNCMRHGQFLMGGWDASRGLVWWQDPGYRTPRQMVSFGKSLLQPIHAGFYSIADGFFASLWLDCNLGGLDTGTAIPWNMNLLVAASLPGLVLSAAIVAGIVRGVWCHDAHLRRSLWLAEGSALVCGGVRAVVARGAGLQPGQGFVHAGTDAGLCRLVRGGFGFAAGEPLGAGGRERLCRLLERDGLRDLFRAVKGAVKGLFKAPSGRRCEGRFGTDRIEFVPAPRAVPANFRSLDAFPDPSSRMTNLRRFGLLLIGLSLGGGLAGAAPAAEAVHGAPTAQSLDGRPVDPFDTHAKAIVLIFVSTDCPIANRYAPEIERLYETYAVKQVAFWLVYADAHESVEKIRTHLHDYQYKVRASAIRSIGSSSAAVQNEPPKRRCLPPRARKSIAGGSTTASPISESRGTSRRTAISNRPSTRFWRGGLSKWPRPKSSAVIFLMSTPETRLRSIAEPRRSPGPSR